MTDNDELSYQSARAMYEQLSERAARVTARPGRRSLSRTVILLGACGIVAACAVGILILGRGGTPPARTASQERVSPDQKVVSPYQGIVPAPVGSDPFGSAGREIALSDAASLAGFAVPVPHNQYANSKNLTHVWFGSSTSEGGGVTNEVVLDFVDPGLRVTLSREADAFANDAAGAFAREATTLGLPASSVQTVDGVPALVVPASNGQTGFVDFNIQGTHVAVIGPRPIADLLAVANSMD